ncbi:MAG: MBL fold metallo-hydrolase [Lentimicrobium sp.]|nr:MBL fold metallo-hydrolase [Lentimicrobium sp.]
MKKFLFLTLILPFSLFAQKDMPAAEITSAVVSPGVYRFFVDNRVSVLVQTGDDGVLVVDAAYAQTAEKLKEAIQNISDKPVKYLINTHLHGDHTGGNSIIGKNAIIIAHTSVREFLSKDQVRGEIITPAPPAHSRPGITIEGKMTLEFNEETIEILHLQGGHTTGDLVVYFPKAKVVHVGDLLFAGYFPYVDVSNGGNPLTYLKNQQWIIDNYPDDLIFIGGHGPALNKNELKKYHKSIAETVEIVAKAKSEGMSNEQMKEMRILKNWESFGSFFITEDRWIDALVPYL